MQKIVPLRQALDALEELLEEYVSWRTAKQLGELAEMQDELDRRKREEADARNEYNDAVAEEEKTVQDIIDEVVQGHLTTNIVADS